MPDSPQTCITVGEEVPLNLIAGSGNTQNNDNNTHEASSSTGQRTASFCDDTHHRKLAICSIICGISCIGITALINSVKAEKTKDPEVAAEHSRKAKKFGIISIITWVSILALTPILMALISYLLSLRD